MNRWLYRAAGTVGIAGGFLLLGAGSAQADSAQGSESPGDGGRSMDELLDEVFSPTGGLPPLGLPGDRVGVPDAAAVTLDPNDGRLGPTLPGLGSPLAGLPQGVPVPLGAGGLPQGVPVPLGAAGLPQGVPVPLGAAGLPDAVVGTGLPADQLATLDGQLLDLPDRMPGAVSSPDTDPRILPVPSAPDRPAPSRPVLDELDPSEYEYGYRHVAGAEHAPAPAGAPEIVDPVPLLGAPLTGPVADAVLGGRPLGDVVTAGDLTGQLPVAGPMASPAAGHLPVVSDVIAGAHRAAMPVSRPVAVDPADPLGVSDQVTGGQLPPVIAQQLATQTGLARSVLAAPGDQVGMGNQESLPLLGDGLDHPLTRMVGIGNLHSQLPVLGPVAGSSLGGLPMVGDPAPAAAPAGASETAGERPIAGDDPLFTGSTATGRHAA